MSNTAARLLVERLSDQGGTILVARDFDVSGFSIVQTLRSRNRRYQFRSRPNVVDLGLRLADAAAMGLDSEPVDYRNRKDPRIRLRQCGATADECAYLVAGERIELNAMDSAQFIDWLEKCLTEAGVAKVVPNADVVTTAYRRAVKRARVQQAIDKILDEEEVLVEVPENLQDSIRDRITGTADSWDRAIWSLAVDAVEEES